MTPERVNPVTTDMLQKWMREDKTREQFLVELEELFVLKFEAQSIDVEYAIQDQIFALLTDAKNIEFGFDLKRNQIFA